MIEHRAALQPQIVERIREVLEPSFDAQQKGRFNQVTAAWESSFNHLQELSTGADQLLSQARSDVEYGGTQLTLLDRNLLRTHEFIYQPDSTFSWGRLPALWGRVLVNLHIRSEHPWLAKIRAERREVAAFLQQAQSNLDQAPAHIEREFTPQIRSAEGERDRTEAEVFRFCERVAVRTADGGLSYAQVVPFRSYDLADAYGQAFYLNVQRVPDLAGFVKQEEDYIRHRARRDRAFRSLVTDPLDNQSLLLTPLVDVPANRLPAPLQNRLKAWTTYHFLIKLSEAGLIERPDLPDILIGN